MSMIKVENLKKEFQKTIKDPGLKGSVKSLFHKKTEIVKAVDGITFDVDEGEILGFIGPNGAGKSTAIKMLTGILTPTSGTLEINGQIPYKNRKNYVKEIGVVFGQRTQLWWDLPLVESFSVLKEIYKIEPNKFKDRMEFLNNVLELETFIKSPVRTLSLGQRMRADIAASMLHSPKVLFLDEPTIGLDVVVKDNIRNAIKEILLTEEQIQSKVKELAAQLSAEYAGKDPVFIGVLKGVVIFFADMVRNIDIPCEIDFMSIASYSGATSTGRTEIRKDVSVDIKDRHVVILEDIYDTGNSLTFTVNHLLNKEPASLKVCTFLDKPDRRVVDMKADYVGMQIPDEFVVGYGLDYDEKYRNLPYVGILKPSVYRS